MAIKTVKLKEEVAVMLNRAKGILLENPKNKKVTDEFTVREALDAFLKNKK